MPEIRVALLGLGNVGSAVARAIAYREVKDAVEIAVAAAAGRSGGVFFDDRFALQDSLAAKERGLPLASRGGQVIPNLETFVDALRGHADIVVESLPSLRNGG